MRILAAKQLKASANGIKHTHHVAFVFARYVTLDECVAIFKLDYGAFGVPRFLHVVYKGRNGVEDAAENAFKGVAEGADIFPGKALDTDK